MSARPAGRAGRAGRPRRAHPRAHGGLRPRRRAGARDGAVVGLVNALLALAVLTLLLGIAHAHWAPPLLRSQEEGILNGAGRDAAEAHRALAGLAQDPEPGTGAALRLGLGGPASWFLSRSDVHGAAMGAPGTGPAGHVRASVRPPAEAPGAGLMPEAFFHACPCAGNATTFKLNGFPLSRLNATSLESLVVRITDSGWLAPDARGAFKVYAMNATQPPPPGAGSDLAWDQHSIWAAALAPGQAQGQESIGLTLRSSNVRGSSWTTPVHASNAETIDLGAPQGADPRLGLRSALYGDNLQGTAGLFDLWFVNAHRAFGSFALDGAESVTHPDPAARPPPRPLDVPLAGGGLRLALQGPHAGAATWTLAPGGMALERGGGAALEGPLPVALARTPAGPLALTLRWWGVNASQGAVAGQGFAHAEATVARAQEARGAAPNATLRLPTPAPALLAEALTREFLRAGATPHEFRIVQGPGWLDLAVSGPCDDFGRALPGVPPVVALNACGAQGQPALPLPEIPGGPPLPGTGAITVCLVMVNPAGGTDQASPYAGGTFIVPGANPPPAYPGGRRIPDSRFTFPLNLTHDLLLRDGVPDAECRTHRNLTLVEHWYGQLLVQGIPRSRFADLYNDQHTQSVSDLGHFREYSPELFTPDPLDDALRDTNADGHIVLSPARPHRVLLVRDATPAELGLADPFGDVLLDVRAATLALRIGGA